MNNESQLQIKPRTNVLLNGRGFVYNNFIRQRKFKEVILLIKDRGTIKWTAMMLPEHVEQIREMWDHDTIIPKPTIDEQTLELFNNSIQFAFTEHKLIKITSYEKGYYLNTIGYVKKIDTHTCKLTICTLEDDLVPIPTAQIVEVALSHPG